MKTIILFRWFEPSPPRAGVVALMGVHTTRLGLLLKVPHVVSAGCFLRANAANKVANKDTERAEPRTLFKHQHLVMGADERTGELAFLSPYVQAWIKCDWLADAFERRRGVVLALVHVYAAKQEFRLRVGALGLSVYVRFSLPAA